MKDTNSTVDLLFAQMTKALESRGDKIAKGLKCVAKFDIDGETWTLELLDEKPRLAKGETDSKVDVELRVSEHDFVKLVMGTLSPQTAFLLGKLKLSGDVTTALKLTPILAAARPQTKL